MRMIIENPSYKIIYIIAQEYLREKISTIKRCKNCNLGIKPFTPNSVVLGDKVEHYLEYSKYKQQKIKKRSQLCLHNIYFC